MDKTSYYRSHIRKIEVQANSYEKLRTHTSCRPIGDKEDRTLRIHTFIFALLADDILSKTSFNALPTISLSAMIARLMIGQVCLLRREKKTQIIQISGHLLMKKEPGMHINR